MKYSFAVLSFFVFSVLYANNEVKIRSLENRVSRLEKNQLKLEETAHVAGDGFDIDKDVGLGVDVIWWGLNEDGTGFVIKGTRDDNGVNLPQKLKYPQWSWEVGVRAYGSFNMGHDNWDVNVTYTYYNNESGRNVRIGALEGASQTSTTSSSTLADSPVLITVWSAVLGSSECNYAGTQYFFNLNQLDFDFSRAFWLSPYFVLRPAMGIRAARADQHSTIRYTTQYTSGAYTYDDTIRLTEKLKAIGLKADFDTEWYVNQYFKLYFDLGFSLLWGDFSLSNKEIFQNVGAGTSSQFTFKNDHWSTQSIVDMAIGFKFGWWFWKNMAHLEFTLGWDEHLWFNYNKIQKVVNRNSLDTYTGLYAENNGNLTLSGLTGGVRLDF